MPTLRRPTPWGLLVPWPLQWPARGVNRRPGSLNGAIHPTAQARTFRVRTKRVPAQKAVQPPG